MDIRFTLDAAEQLVDSMEIYCTNIIENNAKLRNDFKFNDKWNDGQYIKFIENNEKIQKNLNEMIQTQCDYVDIFEKKINELRS